MDRVYLQGSEEVDRAGRNIDGAAETISRAALTIDGAASSMALSVTHAVERIERLNELPLADQRTLRDYFAATANEFDVRNALEELGRTGGLNGLDALGRNAAARFAHADAMLKARAA